MNRAAQIIGIAIGALTLLTVLGGAFVWTVQWQVKVQLEASNYVSADALKAHQDLVVTELEGIKTQVENNSELNQTILSAVLDN